MNWVHDDGGRYEAGFKGSTDDCVVRAIAIVGRLDYRQTYDELFDLNRSYTRAGRSASPRRGVANAAYRRWFVDHRWSWTPTMHIGAGTTVHLRPDELPSGRLVVRCSKHLVAVIDGVIHDTHDPSRDGTRAVYGYWAPPESPDQPGRGNPKETTMTTPNDCGLTVHMVASRNYQIVDPNNKPITDASGIPLRFRSKTEALTEIDAMCADADAGIPQPFDNGRDVEVLVAVRNEFAANPNVGVSALYKALRAAGVKVSKSRMDPAVATVRNELQQAS